MGEIIINYEAGIQVLGGDWEISGDREIRSEIHV